MDASQLTVPQPLPDDGEDVTSALETAAIFIAQGDMREAARWVRRAAEAASDAGSDMRALTLARVVADLNTASVAPRPPAPAAAPEPAAPPAVSVLAETEPEPPSSEELTPRVSAPPPVPEIVAAPAAAQENAYPPPPPLPPLPPADLAKTVPQFVQSPVSGAVVSAPASAPSSPTPSSPAPRMPPPVVIAAAAPPAPPPLPAGAASSSSAASPLSSTVPGMPPSAPAPAQMPTPAPTVGRVYTPAAVIAAAPMVPVTPATTSRGSAGEPPAIAPEAPTAPGLIPASATRATVPALLHQALRASVEPTNEAGVFRLKLLAANEMASLAGQEALVVLLDPNGTLLRD